MSKDEKDNFKWEVTPEEYDFGNKLDDEWISILRFLLETNITTEMQEWEEFLEGEN